jgi:hypothetical protein
MKQLLTLFAACIALNVLAQNATNSLENGPDSAHAKYFVVLENGNKIYANDLAADYSYHNANPYLVLDNKKHYGLDSLTAYQASNGFFQKFPKTFTPNITAMWFKREEANKINIYSKRYTVPDLAYVYDGFVMPTGTTHEKKEFYVQVGNQLPQKFTYEALKDVVRSNPESLKLLNQGHNLAQLKGLAITTGCVMFVAGLLQGGCNTEVKGDCGTNRGVTLALGGIATALLPLLIKPSKKYEEAVYYFNKQ